MKTIADQVIDAYGGVKATQKALKYDSPEAVYVWRYRGLPKRHIAQIHLDTGIPLKKLLTG